jgi:plastocyanin
MQNIKSLLLAAILIIVIILGGIFLYSKSGGVNQTTQGNPGSNQQNQNSKEIILTSGGFSPSTLIIKTGTMVAWINKSGKDAQVDSDPNPINTSYPAMNFDTFSDGSSVSLVFEKAGTYGYHNQLNPSQKGSIIVQ